MSRAVLLGLDPGLANLGIAVVELVGGGDKLVHLDVMRTEKSAKKRDVLASDDNLRRAREVSVRLMSVFTTYKIAAICAESMSFPRSSSAAAKMAMCWGAAAMLVAQNDIPLVQASPQEIKQTVCGRKDASKEDVEAAVRARYPNAHGLFSGRAPPIAPSYREHAYDAAAAIMTALVKSEAVRAIRKMAG